MAVVDGLAKTLMPVRLQFRRQPHRLITDPAHSRLERRAYEKGFPLLCDGGMGRNLNRQVEIIADRPRASDETPNFHPKECK